MDEEVYPPFGSLAIDSQIVKLIERNNAKRINIPTGSSGDSTSNQTRGEILKLNRSSSPPNGQNANGKPASLRQDKARKPTGAR